MPRRRLARHQNHGSSERWPQPAGLGKVLDHLRPDLIEREPTGISKSCPSQEAWRRCGYSGVLSKTQLEGRAQTIEKACDMARVSRAGYYRAWGTSQPRCAETALRMQRLTLFGFALRGDGLPWLERHGSCHCQHWGLWRACFDMHVGRQRCSRSEADEPGTNDVVRGGGGSGRLEKSWRWARTVGIARSPAWPIVLHCPFCRVARFD